VSTLKRAVVEFGGRGDFRWRPLEGEELGLRHGAPMPCGPLVNVLSALLNIGATVILLERQRRAESRAELRHAEIQRVTSASSLRQVPGPANAGPARLPDPARFVVEWDPDTELASAAGVAGTVAAPQRRP
jgi:hypothetical protein